MGTCTSQEKLVKITCTWFGSKLNIHAENRALVERQFECAQKNHLHDWLRSWPRLIVLYNSRKAWAWVRQPFLVSFVCSMCNDNGLLTHFIDSKMHCSPPPYTFLAARQLECVLWLMSYCLWHKVMTWLSLPDAFFQNVSVPPRKDIFPPHAINCVEGQLCVENYEHWQHWVVNH